MSEVGLVLRTEKCMSTSMALIADTFEHSYILTRCIAHKLNGLFTVYWFH
jgi:hypothetical protein